MTPIQVLGGRVLIPVEYLGNATEFSVELQDGHVVVQPKLPLRADDAESEPTWLQRIVGMVETTNPTASSDVKEILKEEFGRRKPIELNTE